MGQVPHIQSQTNRICIIGSGKVARHFAHYFTLLNIPFVSWSRKSGGDLSAVLSQCDRALILIKDSAIAPFAKNHIWPEGIARIHFSGSLVVNGVFGAHPLSTFTDELYDLETYRRIPFVCDRGFNFKEKFPELPNAHFEIAPEQKTYYHALCVMAGNFTTLLWQNLFHEFETKLGLDPSVAFPFLQQTARNLENGKVASLTGPLARKDWEVIDAHLSALKNQPFENIYKTFVSEFASSLPKEECYENRI